jgi:hypothetical protein
MCMENKERKNRKVKKNMCMREWKRKRKGREREKRSGKKDMRGMNQVKRK